jgi:hypothetical protein
MNLVLPPGDDHIDFSNQLLCRQHGSEAWPDKISCHGRSVSQKPIVGCFSQSFFSKGFDISI